MKQTIEIDIPEGYVAKYNTETQKIDIVKKNNRPKTWEEYCDNSTRIGKYLITDTCKIVPATGISNTVFRKADRNLIASEEEAEAFLALMQLRLLRKAWVGDWEPDWTDSTIGRYSIAAYHTRINVLKLFNYQRALSFPDKDMAVEFTKCFKDLLETAKPLL